MTVRLVLGCLALTVGATGSAAQPASTSAAPACVGVDFAEGVKASAREAGCLVELRKSVSRKGEVLTLRLENGATRSWRSNHKACANDEAKDCVEYFLIGYYPAARAHSILAQYYEGASVDIVGAAAGRTLSVHGVPHFSPDGSVFVVLNNDMENGGPDDYDVAVGSTATTPPLAGVEALPDVRAGMVLSELGRQRPGCLARSTHGVSRQVPARELRFRRGSVRQQLGDA
jgi:hypothetical protein